MNYLPLQAASVGPIPTPDFSSVPARFLERDQPFSQSMLWGLGRGFYEKTGPSAWASGVVPYYITSNPFIAHAYAQLVLAYLSDCLSAGGGQVDPAQPIYLVELAAGHGKFSFFFLQELQELKAASPLRDLDIRYVMADLAQSNLAAWDAQPLFEPFRACGLLDSALFDLEHPGELRLRSSGTVLRPGELRNPLIVFANYIFDTVVNDLFRIEGGKVQEGLVSLRCPAGESLDLTSPALLSQLAADYSYRPLDSAPYPHEPILGALLEEYRGALADTDLLIPSAALRCVRWLSGLSNGRLLLVASDKGFTHLDEMFFSRGDHVQYHGSFSCMVNFHAIGRFVAQLGGTALLGSKRHLSLKTAAFVLGLPEARLPVTRHAFTEHAERLGPCDYYRLISSHRTAGASIEPILALLYLSRFDPDVFCQQSGALVQLAGSLSGPLRDELLSIMKRIRARHYPIGCDLPFELSRVYLALGRPREALRCCQDSLRIYGEHAITWCNAGICHACNEEPEEALRCLRRALDLEPDHATARAWLARLAP